MDRARHGRRRHALDGAGREAPLELPDAQQHLEAVRFTLTRHGLEVLLNVVAAARDTPSSLATSLGRAPSGPPRSTACMAAWARCDSPKLL